jgi:hypothetical protein
MRPQIIPPQSSRSKRDQLTTQIKKLSGNLQALKAKKLTKNS